MSSRSSARAKAAAARSVSSTATKAGDTIEVSAPRNDFELAGNPASYLFIAGGIGITPIRSMIHHLRNTGGKPYKLYYLSRTPEMTAFRDEFASPEYRGKAVVHHDMGDVDQSLDLWPMLEKPKGRASVLLRAARTDGSGARHDRPLVASGRALRGFRRGQGCTRGRRQAVHRAARQTRRNVEIPADKSILETLRAHGCVIPSSCESGTCGTCRVGLLAGEPDHRDLVLSDSRAPA